MSEVAGVSLKLTKDQFSMAHFLPMQLEEHLSALEVISDAASKEHSLRKAVEKMSGEWKEMAFSLSEYRETGTSILLSIEDVQMLLDDHIVKMLIMKGSPFIKPFEEEIL